MPEAFQEISVRRKYRQYESEYHSGFFDNIAKKEQGRKLTHSRNCRCSSHFRTSATFALCNLKVKIIQKYVAEINKNASDKYQREVLILSEKQKRICQTISGSF